MEGKKSTYFWSYLRPIFQNWKFYLWALILPINKAVYTVWIIYIIKIITRNIELWDASSAIWSIYVFWAYVIVYYIIDFIRLKLYYLDSRNILKRTIQSEYVFNFITLDNNDAERLWTWRFVAVIQQGIEIRSRSLSDLFFKGIYIFLSLVISFFLIKQTSLRLALLYLVILIFSIVIVFLLDKYAVFRRNKRRDEEHKNTSSIIRLIMSKFEVLQSGKLRSEIDNLMLYLKQADIYNQKTGNYVRIILILPEASMKIAQFFVMLAIWVWVIRWNYLFADFVALIGILIVIEKILRDMSAFFKDTTKNLTYVYKLLSAFESMQTLTWYNEWIDFTYKYSDIQIKSIWYWYDDAPVFSNFSLDIAWWSKTAFVWVSWSWKSTLVKLIAWYLRPDRGAIIIDWQNLIDVSLKSYYKHIWYLTQEPSVFDGTLLDNLTYAIDGKVDDKELDNVIRLAKCEFIYDFTDWLETEIGERWIRLSWWQRQRLAIAKIFLKDPEIIILDEPTSALDSFSEEAITEAMHNLFENRTVIIIAHRLQTVKNADDIIVLDQGKVIERWTHDNLVSQWWSYAKMLELQSWF